MLLRQSRTCRGGTLCRRGLLSGNTSCGAGNRVDRYDADRHLSDDQYSGRLDHLELRQSLTDGDEGPDHDRRRARTHDDRQPLRQAILAAAEVATPAFVATLSICIVFVPILFLGGVGGYLFAPLALSVIFAMMASYFLSRKLVPTMLLFLLGTEEKQMKAPRPSRRSVFGRIGDGFEARFEALARTCEGVLDWALAHRAAVVLPALRAEVSRATLGV